MEIWKDVKGFEGLYQVSNYGNVKSCITKKILKQAKHHSGYMVVCLSKSGTHKNYSVHRLVANAFISNYNNYKHINHKDENKQNNSVENLEWCTVIYNNNYGSRIEKARRSCFKKVLQFDVNGKFIAEWESLTLAAKQLSICKASISQCCNGNYKTAGGYIWKYKKALV